MASGMRKSCRANRSGMASTMVSTLGLADRRTSERHFNLARQMELSIFLYIHDSVT
jgi:hypothetical protein